MEQTNIKEHGKSSKSKGKEELSPGEVLKQTREKKGISLDSIHEATKIPLDALRAIEEGYTVGTISSFYHKGFIKMYAKYLEIEIGEFSAEVKKEEPEEPPKPIKIKADFDIQQWVRRELAPERKKLLLIILGILLSFFILFKIMAFVVHIATTKKVPVVEQVQSETPAPAIAEVELDDAVKDIQIPPTVKVKEVQAPQTQVNKVKVSAPVVAEQKNVSLTVRAKRDSWLRVLSDGEIVFQSTLQLGAVETWVADKEIEISGRNINQLEFELNGKMIGSLGRADRRAKKVVVTKEGLTVTK